MSRREIKRQTEGVRRIGKEETTDEQTMEKERGKLGRKDKKLERRERKKENRRTERRMAA
jgi:hypothetical protein